MHRSSSSFVLGEDEPSLSVRACLQSCSRIGQNTMEHEDIASTASRSPVLVMGIGNILLRDEGVGIRVIEAMRGMSLPPGVELVDGATGGLDLIDVVSGRRKLIVIDAADGDYKPGSIFRLSPEDLAPAGEGSIPQHEMGLLETLKAVAQIGSSPEEVVIFGIQPEVIAWGLDLSDELAAVVPRVIELVLKELQA
jgi:hydrogenase maturation protease